MLLDEFKEYLKVDGNYEDTTLNLFLNSAKQTLEHAGVKIPEDLEEVENEYDLHKLAIYILAAHYYENKQAVSNNAQNIIPFSVQHMILQLKLVNIDESGTV